MLPYGVWKSLKGWVPADHLKLPRMRDVDAHWRLGVAATGLDRITKRVRLADGEQVPYDRLLIATGTRARQWPNPTEAALQGVHTIRSRDDAAQLQNALAEPPSRVLVIGAGFIGSEVASVCRELGLPVTVVERGSAPLVGARRGDRGDRRADAARSRCGPALRSRRVVIGG
ncbi:FAD-dependent oxidoreductase [Streptomyces bungoensis]|uniref:FAD-dependent oxidoreductase n=1 Tax=Streptomyces bungoensis TaxID=285568 RepID=UPI000A78337C|nr:FAD/NAD(P)-binding oxidoreductase [Streptomyces bungoensis]